MSCSCIPGIKSSSQQPVKRYNLLVPDIFPPPPGQPDFKKELPNNIQKKIKKLGEYLEKYPERSEKVSRRLERRIRKDLQAGRYGNVKVGAYAYVYLCGQGRQSGAARFVRELLGDDEDVATVPLIPTLVRHQQVELRGWAMDIVAAFTHVQTDSRFQSKIEEYLDEMCDIAKMSPEDIDPSGERDATEVLSTVEGMRISALASLAELLKLNGRTQVLPPYLEAISECGLDSLHFNRSAQPQELPDISEEDRETNGGDHSSDESKDAHQADVPVDGHAAPQDGSSSAAAGSRSEAPSSPATSPAKTAGAEGSEKSEGAEALASTPSQPGRARSSFNIASKKVDNSLKGVGHKMRSSLYRIKTVIVDRRPRGGQRPVRAHTMAEELLQDLADFSQDSSTRRLVLEHMFNFIDSRQYWSSPDKVEACVSIFRRSCLEDHQYFVLFSSFIRHLGSPKLSTTDKATLIKLAAAEGELQQSNFSAASLIFALSELPQHLPQPADSSGKIHLKKSILRCITRLAVASNDAEAILEAVNGSLERIHIAALAMASLQCIQAALAVIPTLPDEPHSHSTSQLLLQELLSIVTTRTEAELRRVGHSVLQALLAPNSTTVSEQQMSSVLSASWHQLMRTTATPDDFVMVYKTLCAALHGGPPELVFGALPFVLALHRECIQPLEGKASALSPAQRLAGVVISDLLFEKLADMLPCPGLDDLAAGVESVKNAVQVDSAYSLEAVSASFKPYDNFAEKTLDPLKAISDKSGAASEALAAAGLSSSALQSDWEATPVEQPAHRSFSSRTVSGEGSGALPAPSEQVLKELQANFASLAVAQEDVLMTGAVGVGSLMETAKVQAMEAELAFHPAARDGGRKRDFFQTVRVVAESRQVLQISEL